MTVSVIAARTASSPLGESVPVTNHAPTAVNQLGAGSVPNTQSTAIFTDAGGARPSSVAVASVPSARNIVRRSARSMRKYARSSAPNALARAVFAFTPTVSLGRAPIGRLASSSRYSPNRCRLDFPARRILTAWTPAQTLQTHRVPQTFACESLRYRVDRMQPSANVPWFRDVS